jgi:hypothetical protein
METPMRSNLLRLAVFVLGFAVPLAAQCTAVANSGCPTSSRNNPQCSAAPRVGMPLQVSCQICIDRQVIFVGTTLSVPLPLNPPIACGSAPCLIACAPLIFFPTGSFQFTIPNDPTLVGAELCTQCVCGGVTMSCLAPSLATRVVVQP